MMEQNGLHRSITAYGTSDVGLVRDNNEDSFLMFDVTRGEEIPPSCVLDLGRARGFLLLVADGVGGHDAGEVASRMAVEHVSQQLSAYFGQKKRFNRPSVVSVLRAAISHANAQIYQRSQTDGACRGMGTTVTAALLYDDAVFFAQVGDSRGYIIRGPAPVQMTRDQRWGVDADPAYDEPSPRAWRNVLLQALGTTPHVTVPISCAELQPGDWVLLCSDGLTDLVAAEHIGEILHSEHDLQETCNALIEAAKAGGGTDNITVVLGRLNGDGRSSSKTIEIVDPQVVETSCWKRFLLCFTKRQKR